jgi:purine-cytosine permease-like protein
MAQDQQFTAVPAVAPSPLEIEHRGVDTVPLTARHYGPRHIFSILYGSNLTYSTIIFGSFPIVFGLSWWASVTSMIVGTVVGSALLAPMALFGPRTGTNNAVSSGAHFGVAGRFIGSALALFSALGFTAITIWTSGDALTAGVARMTGTQVSGWGRAVGYGVIAAVVLLICLRGIHLMVRIQERAVPVMSVVLLIGVLAFAPKFDSSYPGGELLLGSLPATWIASALLFASVVLSYGPFVGDWTRYVSPTPGSPQRVAGAAFIGALFGLTVPFLWGIFVTSTFAAQSGDFIHGLVASSSGWYVLAVVLIGLVAGIAQGTIGLYGTGLDTSSLIPRLSRRQSTLLIATIAIVMVYLGAFVWDIIPVINAFIVVLLVVTAPWVVIMTIGYFHRKGFYLVDDLQVFTRRLTGGRYWFWHGWNWRASLAWLVASVLGLLFATAQPLFTGPLAGSANGIDLSFAVSSLTAALLYWPALKLFPEPDDVMPPPHSAYGSEGSEAISGPVLAVDAEEIP